MCSFSVSTYNNPCNIFYITLFPAVSELVMPQYIGPPPPTKNEKTTCNHRTPKFKHYLCEVEKSIRCASKYQGISLMATQNSGYCKLLVLNDEKGISISSF